MPADEELISEEARVKKYFAEPVSLVQEVVVISNKVNDNCLKHVVVALSVLRDYLLKRWFV